MSRIKKDVDQTIRYDIPGSDKSVCGWPHRHLKNDHWTNHWGTDITEP